MKLPFFSSSLSSVSSLARGAFWMILGVFFFAASNIYIQPLSTAYPLGQMIFIRSLITLIPLLIVLLFLNGKAFFSSLIKGSSFYMSIQGALSAGCLFLLFYGFAHLPMPIATSLCFAEVFVLALFGIIFLKERFSLGQWSALGLGFVGIVLIAFQETSLGPIPLLASLACILAITLDSVVLISLKKILVQQKTAITFTLYILFCGVGGGFFFPFETWQSIDPETLIPLVCFSTFMALGQFFLLLALKNQAASLLSALIYTQIIWALLFTFLEGGVMPSLQEWCGITLVIGAGLVIYLYAHLTRHFPWLK